MIGLVITGHGSFASGMADAVNLLVGKPEKFIAVDYLQEDSTDELEIRLKKAIASLYGCNGILIMTDIYSGQPCKIATQLADKQRSNDATIRVLAGANLGMVMQANMARAYVSDVSDLANMALEEAHRQLIMPSGVLR